MAEPEQLAQMLAALGCPAGKSREMAEQLDKRAQQLAAARGRPHDEALAHLLKLMAGGWAARSRVAPIPEP